LTLILNYKRLATREFQITVWIMNNSNGSLFFFESFENL
jgi:hypothetical protein